MGRDLGEAEVPPTPAVQSYSLKGYTKLS